MGRGCFVKGGSLLLNLKLGETWYSGKGLYESHGGAQGDPQDPREALLGAADSHGCGPQEGSLQGDYNTRQVGKHLVALVHSVKC